MSANPTVIDVTRGGMIESHHRGAVAVVRDDGKLLASLGDTSQLIYPRSSIKPLQAIQLIESGAAEAYQLTDRQLALACASHNGESIHVETVRRWLMQIGLNESALECGVHPPRRSEDQKALINSNIDPSAAHNNCSGKHAGFLSSVRHLGLPSGGYIEATHPIQQRVLSLLEDLADVPLTDVPRGIDGCGIPVAGIALQPLALSFARFASGQGLSTERRHASKHIYRAMVSEPTMVAGTGRWCTRAILAGKGSFIVKTGAEGVFCGAVPDAGIGIALKIDDGASRASECFMGAVLSRISGLQSVFKGESEDLVRLPVLNVAGNVAGVVRPSEMLEELLDESLQP